MENNNLTIFEQVLNLFVLSIYLFGVILCSFKYFGVNTDKSTCDHVTGEFKCRPGYTGIGCLNSCPNNTYGYNCEKPCDCSEFSDCYHVTGKIYDNIVNQPV